MKDPAARLGAYTAALNRFDMDAVEQMFAEDAVYASPGLTHEMQGRGAIMAAFRAYFEKHPDQVNEDFDILALDAQTVEARWTLKSSRSHRTGTQRITYDEAGRMIRVEVSDD